MKFHGLATSILGRLLLGGFLCLFGISSSTLKPVQANEMMIPDNQPICPQPLLSRLKRHRIAPGETLESIARQYNLIPATLMGMNPSLRQGKVPVGEEIVIPPFNGIEVEIPLGQAWQNVVKAYGGRPDVAFEVNGCQTQPTVLFIPGVNWSPKGPPVPALAVLSGYPLSQPGLLQLGYGWQLNPAVNKVIFHSGLDLSAEVGTPVLAVGAGKIAFAGERGGYGQLVVVNHASGKQTRYAHLSNIAVRVGQTVQQGEILGTVGTTGEPDSNQPHLHFEIRYNSDLGWIAEDPKPYFPVRR